MVQADFRKLTLKLIRLENLDQVAGDDSEISVCPELNDHPVNLLVEALEESLDLACNGVVKAV